MQEHCQLEQMDSFGFYQTLTDQDYIHNNYAGHNYGVITLLKDETVFPSPNLNFVELLFSIALAKSSSERFSR